MSDPILGRIRAVRAEGPRRSPLANWLRRHHREFAQVIQQNGANWEGFGRVFVEEGLLPRPEHFDMPGPEGRLARRRVAQTVRKAWSRVRQDPFAGPPPAAPPPIARLPAPPAPDEVEAQSTAQDRLARLKRQTLNRSGRTT
ncbi:hypothetical protein [Teichococcus aestuarii]|uniref:hypothetical protein n=1 Tax=Teichococcus aestuarii TaxID=568898 RepID=UPI0011B1E588|nr:hypothetical protein [Pseudoroseomonas aestuarii]